MARLTLSALAWAVGGRIPRRLGDALARGLAPGLALLPLAPVRAWEHTATLATGRQMTRRDRTRLVEAWLRNTFWSFSLAGWSDEEILQTVDVAATDIAKLRDSLAGPGLVLALPHMGSWDFAGAWCARIGIKVVSVAERLPDGLYERFRAARDGMGMEIHPVDGPDLMRSLADAVRAGKIVCLLSDRDLSSRGLAVQWPGAGTVKVPAGPALLARRTGADLRVATTRFEGGRLSISVTDAIAPGDPTSMMQEAVGHFAEAVAASPSNWLMLRKLLL